MLFLLLNEQRAMFHLETKGDRNNNPPADRGVEKRRNNDPPEAGPSKK
jgi:hypothetical protein